MTDVAEDIETSENEDTEASEKTEQTIENLDGVFQEADTETSEDGESNDNEPGDDDKGAKDETSEEESEPPADEEPTSVPIAALHDERRKSKAAKEELAQYKAKYDTDEDAPDPAENPEAYEKHIETKVEKRLHQDRINTSREAMLEKHDNYEQMEKTFLVLAGIEPNLIKEMNDSSNPALFAYEKGKGYFDEQRELLRKEIEAEGKDGEDEEDPSKAEKKKASALKMPNLTKAAADGRNSDQKEIDNPEDLGAVFDD